MFIFQYIGNHWLFFCLLNKKVKEKKKKGKEVKKMALAIKPTPKLNAKASEKFLRKINRDLKKPAKLVPTPKLSAAEKQIKAYARRGQK